MPRIALPGNIGQPGEIAKDVNRVIKNHRGKSRPFLMVLVEDDGNAKVVSNMDKHTERIRLLTLVIEQLRGSN